MTVRTRIAPSPTGDPHVGTAYIALFNYCFAKQHGGQFLLRIEDTDQVRSTRESEEMILEALRWTGLTWDEGPDVGGPHGPYRQSERSELYKQRAQELMDNGHAFRCFCTKDRLDALRKEQLANKLSLGYDGHCAHLRATEIAAKLEAGEPFVVRMHVPREGECEVPDRLRGVRTIPWAEVDMQVLLKSDGLPTYHLANVVDDHEMQITHVIRGEEWFSSAPKHLLLYKYFGWQAPELIHMPLLRNADKSKLSKRKNPTSILYYQRIGILPEVLLNYLGTMGWSMADGRERFSLQEMVESFDIDRISLGGPVFDLVKLDAFNGQTMRELPLETLGEHAKQWALNPEYMMPIAQMVQQRANKLSDILPLISHFFVAVPELTPASFDSVKLEQETLLKVLLFAQWRLDVLRTWSKETVEAELKGLSELMEIKLRDFLRPFFIVMSGQPTSTPLFDSLAHLGADLTRARVRHAIAVLGGVSGKKSDKLKKEFEALYAAEQGGEDGDA